MKMRNPRAQRRMDSGAAVIDHRAFAQWKRTSEVPPHKQYHLIPFPTACQFCGNETGKWDRQWLRVNSRSSDILYIGKERGGAAGAEARSFPLRLLPVRAQGKDSWQQQSTNGQNSSCTMEPGICCSERSPERTERPGGSRLKIMETGATWGGCRCQLLFLLLLFGSSFHMLHGQGKSFPHLPESWVHM